MVEAIEREREGERERGERREIEGGRERGGPEGGGTEWVHLLVLGYLTSR